ncbi:PbsX family transcriptional regulator [Paracoccus yeei]|uniref:AbrB/MazE/SpoVT family DNA-binding domain-containing protein n=2 Tax=Paracoccus yeei TaxID=147645 RepID=UPI00049220DC|nr:PbsX family transcriptional regulator [Paracoccus yeei]
MEVAMRAVVKMWGNSASVRIPAAILGESGLRVDQTVNVRSEHGRVIIEPYHEIEADLSDLIAGMTPDNIHEEVDFGGSRGQEAF